jgi:uncharacterized membrane protein SpoIIM required for sporulation
MSKQRFLAKRQAAWRELEGLLAQFGTKAGARPSPATITRFSALVRETASDLATIQAHDWGVGLVDYLNDLVLRGHTALYRSPPAKLARLIEFLAVGFPRVFRRNSGYFLAAAALFFGPLAAAWIAVQSDPLVAQRIVPVEQLEQFDQMYGDGPEAADEDDAASAELPGSEESEAESGMGYGQERVAMAGFYVQHNVGIALQCFARGILLGVGTIFTLLFNGISIGAIAGYVLSLGYAERFLSFVVSHGSFELTAIAIAGGAGLMLGDAAIHPGQRTRGQALLARGLEAVQVAGGAAVMLMIAAAIEAFWSPAPLPAIVKYVVGGGLWLVVAGYLAFAGRGR